MVSVVLGENEKKAHVVAARVVSLLVLVSGAVGAALYYSLRVDAD